MTSFCEMENVFLRFLSHFPLPLLFSYILPLSSSVIFPNVLYKIPLHVSRSLSLSPQEEEANTVVGAPVFIASGLVHGSFIFSRYF